MQCCHGNGSGVRHVHITYGHYLYCQVTVLVIVINFSEAINIYCCHGDGRDVRHVYHGHTHYYQATNYVGIVINCLRLSWRW